MNNIGRSVDMLIGAGVIASALNHLGLPLTPDCWVMFLVLLVCAAIILYSLIILLITRANSTLICDLVMPECFYRASSFTISVLRWPCFWIPAINMRE